MQDEGEAREVGEAGERSRACHLVTTPPHPSEETHVRPLEYVTCLSPHQAHEHKAALKAERERAQGLQETVSPGPIMLGPNLSPSPSPSPSPIALALTLALALALSLALALALALALTPTLTLTLTHLIVEEACRTA